MERSKELSQHCRYCLDKLADKAILLRGKREEQWLVKYALQDSFAPLPSPNGIACGYTVADTDK